MRHFFAWLGLLAFTGAGGLLVVQVTRYSSPESSDGFVPYHPAGVATPQEVSHHWVIIDPGHGGRDEGARGYDLTEKRITLDLARRLERRLRELHFETALTRNSDVYVSLPDRAFEANRYERAFFVSIHFNQSQELAAGGLEVYYPRQKFLPFYFLNGLDMRLIPVPAPANGRNLARAIHDSMLREMPAADRGLKERDLYVLNNVYHPAVLLECGFLSNPFDAMLLKDGGYLDKLAGAIASGIQEEERAEGSGNPASPDLAGLKK